MLKLTQLIEAIKEGALSATKVMNQQNKDLFDEFFVKVDSHYHEQDPDTGRIIPRSAEAIATDALTTDDGDGAGEGAEADEAADNAGAPPPSSDGGSAGGSASGQGGFYHQDGVIPNLRPRMVAIDLPATGPDGTPTNHRSYIPLISLMPFSNLKMDELVIELEMELHQADPNDPLSVSFISKEEKKGFLTRLMQPQKGPADVGNAKLTVKFGQHDLPEGLQLMIEGYSKAIKAQLP